MTSMAMPQLTSQYSRNIAPLTRSGRRSGTHSSWDAMSFAVFEDIDGNGTVELGALARQDDGEVKVQLRDSSTGALVRTIAAKSRASRQRPRSCRVLGPWQPAS